MSRPFSSFSMPVEAPPALRPVSIALPTSLSQTDFTTEEELDQRFRQDVRDLSLRQSALVDVGFRLRELGYHFVTPTPATHAIRLRKFKNKKSQNNVDPLSSLRDLLGWSQARRRDEVDSLVLSGLERAGVLEDRGRGLVRSQIRFSSLDQGLYAHSAFPTQAADSVFFGPDSYRFYSFIQRHADPHIQSILDLGCGTGVGSLGLAAERRRTTGQCLKVHGVDVNPRALELVTVNACLNHLPPPTLTEADATQILGSGFSADLVICNPPFLMDSGQRQYRHGGGAYGTEVPLRLLRTALACLQPGGQILFYCGASVVNGEDQLKSGLHRLLEPLGLGWSWEYEEIDPDIFGEELLQPGYEEVERIAAVGLSLRSSVGSAITEITGSESI